MKKIIINADDFWISAVFNEEILRLLEKGFIKSVTVMVDRILLDKQKEQLEKLKELQKKHNISIWLHLEFLNTSFEDEIQRQWNKFMDLFWFTPSHIDLHKLAFVEDSFKYIEKFCKTNKLPCRNLWIFSPKLVMTSKRAFSWTDKNIEDITYWLAWIKDDSIQEILFHPGMYDPDCKSTLNKWRENDSKNIELLKNILEVKNIEVLSYFDFKNIKLNSCQYCDKDLIDMEQKLSNKTCVFLSWKWHNPPWVLEWAWVIIPFAHRENVFELTTEEIQDTFSLLKEVKSYIDEKYSPDWYNIWWNTWEIWWQNIMHAHLHILPRYSDEPMAGKWIRHHLKWNDNKRTKN